MSRWCAGMSLFLVVVGCGPNQPLTTHRHSVEHWVKALQTADVQTRVRAVRALEHAGRVDATARSAVLAALKDKEAPVRRQACLSLLALGPAAGEAIPLLTQALRDPDAKVRTYAAKALESLQAAP